MTTTPPQLITARPAPPDTRQPLTAAQSKALACCVNFLQENDTLPTARALAGLMGHQQARPCGCASGGAMTAARILYLAGPVTGLPDHNYPAFNAAAARLREAGYEVVNPAELGLPDGLEWIEYMRAGIAAMMTAKCDGVALLPGWPESKGSVAEGGLAVRLGFPVRICSEWLADKGVTP